ncbi:MBOAT family O-acyltransferase [Clostridium oryzae]|uniref:Peptidoglycan O-acetyltransferase n=1 Tax=Clostridium oryzae TaxID=1450648 RepID=A0A1V4ICN0_9CLOT|nr:MBOAT family O-acyltransferase [Clostridium oryzae]OPJ57706.1 peptidoglycan O-acetyltransferase [Clostridium oryzae]
MAFISLEFLVFFPVVAITYFILPFSLRWIWLLISSYYFYMSWNPKYAGLIVLSTLITYLCGVLIGKSSNKKVKNVWLIISLISNLGILFIFKYYNFFRLNSRRILSIFNVSLNIPVFDFLLPVGISFYTFQSLSYVMDVYRGDTKAEKNLGKYALFVSFFPQLTAGPIGKSKELLYQFNEKHYFDYDRVKNGLILMAWGAFQKVFIADRLAIVVNTVYDSPGNYKGFQIITATIFFTFQIYCDFSSYSDIAVGAAEVMGFRLTRNFRQPYFSKSVKEFWRRWHISLSTWFKDYLYIPLGGNRKGKLRTYLNTMIVFILSGLWHGAAMNFIIWGTLHGVYQVLSGLLKPAKLKLIKILNIRTEVFSYKLFQMLTTFTLVSFAWLFFRATTFSSAQILIRNMFYFNPWIFSRSYLGLMGIDSKDFFMSILGIFIIISVNLMQVRRNLRVQLSRQNAVFRWAIYFSCILAILIFGIYGEGYDEQQFIYSQF